MSAAHTSSSTAQRLAEIPSAHAGLLRTLRAEVAEFRETGSEPLTDSLACWLTAQYAAAARRAAEEAQARNSELPVDILHQFSADVVALRKGDHCAERLVLERERFEIARGRSRERMEAQFEEWLQDPRVKERLRPGPRLSEEERERSLRVPFGFALRPAQGLESLDGLGTLSLSKRHAETAQGLSPVERLRALRGEQFLTANAPPTNDNGSAKPGDSSRGGAH